MTVNPGEQTVPSGAIATAMMIVETMHGRVDEADPEISEAMTTGVRMWGRETLLQAFDLIVYTAVHVVKPQSDEDDPLMLLMPAIVARFRSLQLLQVPDDALPIVAGILTAACVDLPPYRWRTGIGPIGDREALVWVYTAWLVVDFMDNAVLGEKPGRFAEIMNATLLQGRDDTDDDQQA